MRPTLLTTSILFCLLFSGCFGDIEGSQYFIPQCTPSVVSHWEVDMYMANEKEIESTYAEFINKGWSNITYDYSKDKMEADCA